MDHAERDPKLRVLPGGCGNIEKDSGTLLENALD